MPRADLHPKRTASCASPVRRRTSAGWNRPSRATTKHSCCAPAFEEAFLEVVDLLTAAQDWAGIAQRCETWIEHYPDHASHGLTDRVHNLRIDALCRVGGIELAYDAYGLEQVTSGSVELADDEIVAVVGAATSGSRLEFLLEHHRRLGVDRFLFVDNGSDDGSVEYLLGEPDTIVWRTNGSYLRSNAGAAWADLVLRRYAPRQWCLVVRRRRAVRLPGLRAPWPPRRSAPTSIVKARPATRRSSWTCTARAACRRATYRPGQDPLEVFPYFDRVHYRLRIPFDGPRRNMTNYWGGVRARMFGGDYGGYLLNKVPLFRYSPGEVLMSGHHWLSRPTA